MVNVEYITITLVVCHYFVGGNKNGSAKGIC